MDSESGDEENLDASGQFIFDKKTNQLIEVKADFCGVKIGYQFPLEK